MGEDKPKAKPRSIRHRLSLAALIMTASVLLSRILGYVRDAVVAARHGATSQTDVYFASFTLPDLMSYMLAGGALSITFLPLFSSYLHRGKEAEGWACFSVVATTVGSALAILLAIAWILAPTLIPPLLPGFTADQIAQTVSLTRIVIPAQMFFYVGGLLGATVMARERFAEAALAPLVYNACIIAGGLLLGPSLGIAGFSWGALIGAALGPFGLMYKAARSRGLTYSPRFSLTDPDMRRFVRLSLPVMVGFSLVSVDEWISRYYASSMADGSISWIQNGRRLMLVPVSVLGQAAGQATLPFLSRLAAEGKPKEAASVLTDAVRVVLFATLAASAWMGVTSEPVVGLFYERGAFTTADTVASAAALVFFSIGISFWALQALMARGFYALQDTWTPMLIASGVAAAVLPIYWILGDSMGHRGLALATTVGMTINAVLTTIALRRKLPISFGVLGRSFARSALIASFGGAAGFFALQTVATQGYFIRGAVGSAAFGLAFAIAATALKAPEWTMLTSRIIGRFRR
ncbi:MAG: putative peptidoglycan lipid II flippase [Myxococcota bacterium]